jgi:hypothetical protein
MTYKPYEKYQNTLDPKSFIFYGSDKMVTTL